MVEFHAAVEAFKDIQKRAIERHGGATVLRSKLARPKSRAALRRIGDDRVLATMARYVFSAGFVWRVIEAKWPGFEVAFKAFDPVKVARLSNEKLSRLARDERIVRNPQKIKATRDNAGLVLELAKEHGSAARCFADWPAEHIVDLWDLLKKRGSRLGGFTGPMTLRQLGVDTPMLGGDVVLALREHDVVSGKGTPTSRKALQAVQDAFNAWREESGLSLTEISGTLSRSVGDVREGF